MLLCCGKAVREKLEHNNAYSYKHPMNIIH